MLILPSYDSWFITLFENDGGYVRRHVTVDVEASDYSYLETIALEKAMMGLWVDMMPVLQDEDPLRQIIFPDALGFKCPDLRIDGKLWEVEKSSRSDKLNNLKHAVDEGSKQANHVIVDLSCDTSEAFMRRIVTGRFKDHINLQMVEFRYAGKYTAFHK